MRIAHISDTHDQPHIVRGVADIACDVIVLTGDILSNYGRRPSTDYKIVPHVERKYQHSWFRRQAKKWAKDFRGRPVIYVPGNHDFIDIGPWLKHYGHTALYTISENAPYVDLLGKRFAGFREITWIEGEWPGEVHDVKPAIERAMACGPDILVTHSPPSGILCGRHNDYGLPLLTSRLCYSEHKITHHLFGHAHDCIHSVEAVMGITFSNAAGRINVIEVP